MARRPDGPGRPSLRKCGDSHDGPDPVLDAFFAWLTKQPRNSPERQVELAREYQAARRAFWEAATSAPGDGDAVRASLQDAARGADCDACVGRGEVDFAMHHDVGLELSADVAPSAAAEYRTLLRARDALSRSNLRLVVAVAKRYRAPKDPLVTLAVTLPFSDLIQEGTVGLMKACDKFDPDLGWRFSTYATWWIRHAINRALADKARLVRIPTHVADKIGKVAREETKFCAHHGRPPTDAELAALADVTVGKVEAVLAARASSRPIPLHGDPDDSDDADDMGDRIARLAADTIDSLEDALALEVDFDGALAEDTPGARVADALDALAPGGVGDAWRVNARRAVEERWCIGRAAPDDGASTTTAQDTPGVGAAGTRTFSDIGLALGVSREQARKWVTCGEEFCREWLRSVGRTPDA